jgi:prepilin-type N-terminal cleavage/methylation domain-containing protein
MKRGSTRGKSAASQCAGLRDQDAMAPAGPTDYWVMRRGVTLLELLLVLLVAGVLAASAFLPYGRARDGILTRQAAERIALAHARARAIAQGRQHVARLAVGPDSITVTVNDTLRWFLPGPAVLGVSLTGGTATDYAPNGLAMGAANERYEVRLGRSRLAILVSRLGRVRIIRSWG